LTIVTLIGIDGTGKSTQCELLVQYMRERGISCRLFYAGNAGYIIGNIPRQYSIYLSLPVDIILKRLCKVSVDPIPKRYRMLKTLNSILLFLNYVWLILPRILIYNKIYTVLVTDRYVYDYVISTIAHQTYSKSLSSLLLRAAPRPDLEILLDVSSEIAFQRKHGEKDLEEISALRRLYLHFAQIQRLPIVDASRSVSETFNQILGFCSHIPELSEITR
jgi:thymidylate kinase